MGRNAELLKLRKDLWLKLGLLTPLFTCNQRQVYQKLIDWDLGFRAPSLHRPPSKALGRSLAVYSQGHMVLQNLKNFKIFKTQLVETAVPFLP